MTLTREQYLIQCLRNDIDIANTSVDHRTYLNSINVMPLRNIICQGKRKKHTLSHASQLLTSLRSEWEGTCYSTANLNVRATAYRRTLSGLVERLHMHGRRATARRERDSTAGRPASAFCCLTSMLRQQNARNKRAPTKSSHTTWRGERKGDG